MTWDHFHKIEKTHPYEFETVGRLLEDFWVAVEGKVRAMLRPRPEPGCWVVMIHVENFTFTTDLSS